jgi:hypothetical protein
VAAGVLVTFEARSASTYRKNELSTKTVKPKKQSKRATSLKDIKPKKDVKED